MLIHGILERITVYMKVIKQRYLNNIVFFFTFSLFLFHFFFFKLKKEFSIFSIHVDTCTTKRYVDRVGNINANR